MFFKKAKDGGPLSNVTGYWLVEIKSLFSILLLRFSEGSREACHNHAFNAVSWILKGELHEYTLGSDTPTVLKPSIFPIITKKSRFHKVYGVGPATWAITFRGPWDNEWMEYLKERYIVLTHGRKVIGIEHG